MKNIIIFFISMLVLSGCTTTQKGTSIGAISGAAVGGIIGHQSDKGAEGAALGAAIGAVGGYLIGDKLKQKFCPVGGKSYDAEFQFCPTHGVELKDKEE